MPRLFTFGCSFTQYGWPTWADIVAYDRNIEYHNYAIAGMGNVGIAHRIVEADLKHQFREDDEIFILWSSWSREDRVRDKNWLTAGSVLRNNNPHYDRSFSKKYWDFNNDIVKNSTAIITTNRLFKDLIKWQASAFDFFTTEDGVAATNNDTKIIMKLYNTELPKLKVVNCTTVNPFKVVQDSHPDIVGHLKIAEIVYNDLNLKLKPSTIEIFSQLQTDLESVFKPGDSFETILRKVNKVLMVKYEKILAVRSYHSLNEDWHVS
jgi:hypothetical protein